MKKTALTFWFGFLLLLLIVTSCKTQVPVNHTKETNHTQKDCTAFASQTEKTPEMRDTLKVFVPVFTTGSKCADCDSLCNAQKNNWLKGLNTQKQSGKSQSGVYYDQNKNLLVAYNILAESSKELVEKIKYRSDQKDTSEIREVPIEMPMNKRKKFFYRSGQVFWAALVFFVLYKAVKMYKNIT